MSSDVCIRLRDTITYLFPERSAQRSKDVECATRKAETEDAIVNRPRRQRSEAAVEATADQHRRRVRTRSTHGAQFNALGEPSGDARSTLEWVHLPHGDDGDSSGNAQQWFPPVGSPIQGRAFQGVAVMYNPRSDQRRVTARRHTRHPRVDQKESSPSRNACVPCSHRTSDRTDLIPLGDPRSQTINCPE